MTQAPSKTIRHDVVVNASLERAFRVFTEQFGDFKPREHNLLTVPIAESVFEPRVGGHIYDRGEDGSLCKWARMVAYEPPNRVVFTWDIGLTWHVETDPARCSEVEVRFSPSLPSAPASNSNIVISNDTVRAGNPSSPVRWRRRVADVSAALRRPFRREDHES